MVQCPCDCSGGGDSLDGRLHRGACAGVRASVQARRRRVARTIRSTNFMKAGIQFRKAAWCSRSREMEDRESRERESARSARGDVHHSRRSGAATTSTWRLVTATVFSAPRVDSLLPFPLPSALVPLSLIVSFVGES
jgi:hypothetical protein